MTRRVCSVVFGNDDAEMFLRSALLAAETGDVMLVGNRLIAALERGSIEILPTYPLTEPKDNK